MTNRLKIDVLDDLVFTLEEFPAELSDDELAEITNLTQKLRGLAETERLQRALMNDDG